jgi:hypothetical protein
MPLRFSGRTTPMNDGSGALSIEAFDVQSSKRVLCSVSEEALADHAGGPEGYGRIRDLVEEKLQTLYANGTPNVGNRYLVGKDDL